MKNLPYAALAMLLLARSATAAEETRLTNAVSQFGQGRGMPNSNDAFYALGPDSKPRDGVPKGTFSEPKVIQSNVFPGTQHTYWVYVPAQYDPTQPTAVMVATGRP